MREPLELGAINCHSHSETRKSQCKELYQLTQRLWSHLIKPVGLFQHVACCMWWKGKSMNTNFLASSLRGASLPLSSSWQFSWGKQSFSPLHKLTATVIAVAAHVSLAVKVCAYMLMWDVGMHMYICMYVHIFTYKCTYMHTCIYAHTHECMRVHAHMHACVCMLYVCMCMHVCVCTHVFVCMCACMYVYICWEREQQGKACILLVIP